DDRALLQMRRDGLADLDIGRERRRDDDEIRILHRNRGIVGHLFGKLEPEHGVECLLAACASDDRAGKLLAPHQPRERRADMTDADESDALEEQITHANLKNSFSASTTARISCSLPTVI